MPVYVYTRNGSVVIETGSEKVTLTEAQGKLVLKKLAEIYGYRLSPVKPDVTFRYDPVGKNVKVNIYEGKTVKSVVIPYKVIQAYVDVLKKLGPGRHDKKEVAREAIDRLLGEPGVGDRLLEYYIDGKFDWKRFFGGRHEYYEFFRAPILVLDKLGLVKEKRGTYIEVTEEIETVSGETLPERLRRSGR